MQQHCLEKYKTIMNVIKSYAHIKNNQVLVNGEMVFQSKSSETLTEFLSELYKALGVSYPKFHKMDLQCKLAFLCTEYAFEKTNFLQENDLSKTAIVFLNSASSLDTDRVYQKSIENKSQYFPSPAVFVYTLPNITIGEIAIRHKITGENAFFISSEFDAKTLVNYIESLQKEQTEAVVAGWINVDENNYEAFIFLSQYADNINKNSIFKPLNEVNITNLYNQK